MKVETIGQGIQGAVGREEFLRGSERTSCLRYLHEATEYARNSGFWEAATVMDALSRAVYAGDHAAISRLAEAVRALEAGGESAASQEVLSDPRADERDLPQRLRAFLDADGGATGSYGHDLIDRLAGVLEAGMEERALVRAVWIARTVARGTRGPDLADFFEAVAERLEAGKPLRLDDGTDD